MFKIEYPNEGLYVGGKARYTRRDPTGQITYARFATPAEEIIGQQIAAMTRLAEAIENANQREALNAAIAQSNAVLARQPEDGVREPKPVHSCETGGPCECGNGLTGGQCFP